MKQQISEETMGRLAVVLLTLLLLFLRFPDFFQSPNAKVIEAYADGIKAYTVIEYHARYDSTYTWYEGMNYPYREHVVPAATQPLLSNSLKLISDYLFDVTPYTRAVVHFSLLLGLLLCALFLYLIFRKFNLPAWFAVPLAIGITFLAPQFHRMISHYGLAHAEVIPVILYLLIRLEESHSWKISVWIAVATTAFSLIHFYYFAIITFVISFYFLFGFLRKPSVSRLLKYAFHYSIQLLLPLVFFYFWMYHNDPVTDRSSQPWGFFYFKAIWEGIFTSMAQPHFQWLDKEVIKIEETTYEGQAYVGLVATLGTLVLLVRWLVGLGKKPFVRAVGELQPFLNKLFLTGLALLLFSFCLPFVIPGFKWLADYAGPIRQFRSVGRFSWAFYYIINIIVWVEIWDWLKDKNWKLAFLIPALGVLTFEAYNHCYKYDLKLDQIKELEEGNAYTDIDGIDYDEFQAILTIPYYNVGSDNFWYDGGGDIVPRSQVLSIQTGLPTTSAMLTRTSLSQTMKQIELILEPYRLPAILEDYPNDNPLLLLVSNYQFSQQRKKYEHLLEESQLLFENDQYQLHRVALNTFQKRIDSRIRKIENTLEFDTVTLNPQGNFLTRDSALTFVYVSYDSLESDSVYQGNGALKHEGAGEVRLFEGSVPQQQKDGYYTFSVWMYLEQDLLPRSWGHIIELDGESGTEIGRKSFQVYREVQALDNGWGLVEVVYSARDSGSILQFVISNDELKNQPMYFDEFLLRPTVSDVYRQEGSYIFKNNRWFSKQ